MPRPCAIVLAAALLTPSLSAALDDWLDASATVPAQGRQDSARRAAEQAALSRALAEFLQQWLSRDDIVREQPLLERWFFAQPQEFVAALTDVEHERVGNRLLWQARVRFDAIDVAARLDQVGLIQPWDRDPTFVALWAGDDFPADLTTGPWARALRDAGIRLSWRRAGEADPPGEQVDGRWTLSLRRRDLAHPLDASRAIATTDVAVIGDVRGQPFEATVALAPHPLAPPRDLQVLQFVERVLALWGPEQRRRMGERFFTAGDFVFADLRTWQDFDHALVGERAVFHLVHPRQIERTLEGGYRVRYGFYLGEGAEATATAWFMNRDMAVRLDGEQRFAPVAP